MVHSHTVHLPLGALLSPCTMCGTGKEYGAMGFEEYTQTKVITGCDSGFAWQWYVPK